MDGHVQMHSLKRQLEATFQKPSAGRMLKNKTRKEEEEPKGCHTEEPFGKSGRVFSLETPTRRLLFHCGREGGSVMEAVDTPSIRRNK